MTAESGHNRTNWYHPLVRQCTATVSHDIDAATERVGNGGRVGEFRHVCRMLQPSSNAQTQRRLMRAGVLGVAVWIELQRRIFYSAPSKLQFGGRRRERPLEMNALPTR